MTKSLPVSRQILFSMGVWGKSTLVWLAMLFLINFYIPPAHEKMPVFIYQGPVVFVFNIVALLVFAGRIWDFVTDPAIGKLSDQSRNPKGRRLPFMRPGTLSAFFCLLLFVPLRHHVSTLNVIWMIAVQLLFYLFITLYSIPYFSLMADICRTDKDRINIATWCGAGFSLGMVTAAQAPILWAKLESAGLSRVLARQTAIGIICLAAFVLTLIPILTIKEPKIPETPASKQSAKVLLQTIFKKRYFLAFAFMTLCYISGLTLVISGMPYFVSVCLGLDVKYMSIFMPLMIVFAFVSYPLANYLSVKKGKKFVLITGLLILCSLLCYLIFLGKYPLSGKTQGALVFILAGIPSGLISVALGALYIDIAKYYRKISGESLEAMYYASKNLAAKMGVATGGTLFACLTLLGKDQGNDLGIRAAAAAGLLIIVPGLLIFRKYYDEKAILAEIGD